MKNQNEILLSEKQIIEIAAKQTEILEDMQLIQSLLYYMPATGNYMVDEQRSLIHSKLQGMEKALDNTTFILYNTTDKRELEGMGIAIEELEVKTGE